MIEYIRNMRKYIGHERLLIAGASVIVYKGGNVLLQKRKDNGCWCYHGGCIELGEAVEETAKRELLSRLQSGQQALCHNAHKMPAALLAHKCNRVRTFPCETPEQRQYARLMMFSRNDHK